MLKQELVPVQRWDLQAVSADFRWVENPKWIQEQSISSRLSASEPLPWFSILFPWRRVQCCWLGSSEISWAAASFLLLFMFVASHLWEMIILKAKSTWTPDHVTCDSAATKNSSICIFLWWMSQFASNTDLIDSWFLTLLTTFYKLHKVLGQNNIILLIDKFCNSSKMNTLLHSIFKAHSSL